MTIKAQQFGGKNYTNLRYADDAVIVSDEEAKLQTTHDLVKYVKDMEWKSM